MSDGIDTTDITLKKRVEFIEKNLENTRNDVIDTKNTLDNFKRIMTGLEKLIDSRIEIFMSTSKRNDFNIDEPEKVEEKGVKEEKKLEISKFIETFSQEFNFINKDEFNEEMENDEIMGKIIEFVKRMLGIKNDEINDKNIEIDGLKIKKTQLENKIKTLNSNITEKENKNRILESKKAELEGKVADLESLKNKLNRDIKQLDDEKKELKNDLESKKNEITRLEGIERNLQDKNSELEKEKKKLIEIDEENSKKMKVFMSKYEEKEKELVSIGDLLQARKLYDKYLSMETRILSKLENILIQRDFESFISSGYTLSSLDNVWDIVKIEYKNISNEDKETLKEVFSFFLNQINKRFKEAKYGLVQVEIGEDFDAVNQVDLSQNSRGRVTECVFYGYGFLKEKENSDDEDVITRIIKSPLVLTA